MDGFIDEQILLSALCIESKPHRQWYTHLESITASQTDFGNSVLDCLIHHNCSTV